MPRTFIASKTIAIYVMESTFKEISFQSSFVPLPRNRIKTMNFERGFHN